MTGGQIVTILKQAEADERDAARYLVERRHLWISRSYRRVGLHGASHERSRLH